MADVPRRSLGQLPDPWARVPPTGTSSVPTVRRSLSRPHRTGVIASAYAWFEMSLGIAVVGLGLVYLYLASSPANQSDNPFAELGVVAGAAFAVLGGIVAVVFAVAARALWKERLSGAVVLVIANGVVLLVAVPQVATSLLAFCVAPVAGLGAAAAGAVLMRHHSLGDA